MSGGLHAPTIPSGPTTQPIANGVAHLSLAELQRKKDNVEAELKALGSVLDSVGSHPSPEPCDWAADSGGSTASI